MIASSAGFSQLTKPGFSQKPPASGTLVGKAMRSCFTKVGANASVIAVLNRADWCSVCQKNSERVEAILPEYKLKSIAFVSNDITDNNSKKISAKYLKKLRISKEVEPIKESGVIILLDAKTHKVISTVSLASSNDEIEKAFDKALMPGS